MTAPAAPPTMAPMLAPRAVDPVWFPITPPTAAPVVAPTTAPFCFWLIAAQPLITNVPATMIAPRARDDLFVTMSTFLSMRPLELVQVGCHLEAGSGKREAGRGTREEGTIRSPGPSAP